MTTITNRITRQDHAAEEWALRVDLAAVFRLAVEFDWHESVANHFSAAVSEDGKMFLLNPRWQHFSTIRASDLLLLDADDTQVMHRQNAPDPSAWCIHGAVHGNVPRARVLLHCHPPHATALCGLKDPSIKPIDQNTGRFFDRVAIDRDFGGLANQAEEGLRIAENFGTHSTMIMGNHGVSVIGETVADAFESLYYLERAARTMLLAYASGQPLNVMNDQLAEKVARGWEDFIGAGHAHFAHWKQVLDRREPDYAD